MEIREREAFCDLRLWIHTVKLNYTELTVLIRHIQEKTPTNDSYTQAGGGKCLQRKTIT